MSVFHCRETPSLQERQSISTSSLSTVVSSATMQEKTTSLHKGASNFVSFCVSSRSPLLLQCFLISGLLLDRAFLNRPFKKKSRCFTVLWSCRINQVLNPFDLKVNVRFLTVIIVSFVQFFQCEFDVTFSSHLEVIFNWGLGVIEWSLV